MSIKNLRIYKNGIGNPLTKVYKDYPYLYIKGNWGT